MIVIADCVNPVREARDGWRRIAGSASAALIEVELICSDSNEHRQRLENRPEERPMHVMTWNSVRRIHFEPWPGDHLILDTAVMTPAEAAARIVAQLALSPR
jgi:chloramphenicol 3-O-phosphotransferase